MAFAAYPRCAAVFHGPLTAPACPSGRAYRDPPKPSGITSWVGVYCFISLTRAWGGAAAVVTTSVRKILTVALSFMLFPKPFGATSAAAVGVAAAGLGLHAYGKVQRERAKAHVD